MITKLLSSLVIAALMHPYILKAQDSARYSTIAFSLGGNRILNKDKFQSPYTYRGVNLSLASAYARVSDKGRQVLEFMYTGGAIQSIVSPKAKNGLLVFNYDYLFNLRGGSMSTKKLDISAGIGLRTLLSSTNYLPGVELPKTYFSGSAWLALSGNAIYSLNNKSSLALKTGIPVFGVVLRPDFEINGKTLTRATFVGKNMVLSGELTYTYRLSPKINLVAGYHFHYFTFEDKTPSVSLLQNGLSIGLSKRF